MEDSLHNVDDDDDDNVVDNVNDGVVVAIAISW